MISHRRSHSTHFVIDLSNTYQLLYRLFRKIYIQKNGPSQLEVGSMPQKEEADLEDCFQYFNKAGLKFLQCLVERKKSKMSKLDEGINSFKEKLYITI